MQPQSGLDQLSETGERIDSLLSALGTSGPMAQQRGEDLVALVTNLYGAGLERLIEVLADAGRLDAAALDALAADELVSGLLLVHGLHPYDVTTRVAAALDSVRPYLGSHAGGVELTGVDELGIAHLTLEGSCNGCPSSTVTVSSTLERAVLEAAPEVVAVDVTGVVAPTPAQPLLQIGLRPGLEPRAPADAEADPVWAHLEVATAPDISMMAREPRPVWPSSASVASSKNITFTRRR